MITHTLFPVYNVEFVDCGTSHAACADDIKASRFRLKSTRSTVIDRTAYNGILRGPRISKRPIRAVVKLLPEKGAEKPQL